MSDTYTRGSERFEMTGSNVINSIEDLNRRFDYGDKMENPAFWLDMLQQQLDEIEEHIQNDRLGKAHDEFADCVFVAVKALMESDARKRHWTATLYARSRQVAYRASEVQETYDERWDERYLDTDRDQEAGR